MRVRVTARTIVIAFVASCAVALGAAAPNGLATDLEGLYVFPSTDPGHVTFALAIGLPSQTGSSTRTFDPGVLYAIHVDNVGDFREHLTFQFETDTTGPLQKITTYGPGDAHLSGETSSRLPLLGEATYNTTATLGKGISFFAGPRRDPFFFDRERYDAIVAGRSAACFRAAGSMRNAYATQNVLAIVIDVPRSLIASKDGRIDVWATASLARSGGTDTYVRLSRVGRPGVSVLFGVGAEDTLGTRIHDVAVAPLPRGAGRSDETARGLAQLLTPDDVQADIGAHVPARYLALETRTPAPSAAPNARPSPTPMRPFGGVDLSSPVMATTLAALYGDAVARARLAPDDGRETPCLVSDGTTPPPNPGANAFPYLDAP